MKQGKPEKDISGRGVSKCKVPEAGLSFRFSRNREKAESYEARCPGAELSKDTVVSSRLREIGRPVWLSI